jgi:hypothetical protein
MNIGDRVLVKQFNNPINKKDYFNKSGEITYKLKHTFEIKFDEDIGGYGLDNRFLYVIKTDCIKEI